MAHIDTFTAGHCTHPACVALRSAGWATCRFPARAYLIRTAHDLWLWDTGYASHFIDHTRAGLFALYRKVTPVHFDASEALHRQLHARGIWPGDLSALILSHFHGDHIAGLRDFPGTPLLCSGAGWQATRGLRDLRALRRGFVPGLLPDDIETRLSFVESAGLQALPAELAPFTHGYPLPGTDGEVWLVDLPGHAAGHLGAFVQTPQGWVLLASDAAWSPTSYREGIGPSRLAHGIMDDVRAYYATLERLHQLHLRGRVRILLTHEGEL